MEMKLINWLSGLAIFICTVSMLAVWFSLNELKGTTLPSLSLSVLLFVVVIILNNVIHGMTKNNKKDKVNSTPESNSDESDLDSKEQEDNDNRVVSVILRAFKHKKPRIKDFQQP